MIRIDFTVGKGSGYARLREGHYNNRKPSNASPKHEMIQNHVMREGAA